MATYLPTLKQLQYLVALSDQGHFGRAAEASFVSQSTLSAGIRELETLLGVTLVERSRRVVRFTGLGQEVVAKARAILSQADELTDLVQAAGKPLVGTLRLAVIPTIAPFLLPRVLPRLRRERPELKLFLREETTDAALEHLGNGRVDCALLALPYAIGDLTVSKIADDPLLLAFPNDHAGRIPDSISPKSIDEGRLLMLEDGHCMKEHALAACNRPELRASATMIATSLHTLVQMVDNGLGVTMLPQMAVDAGILERTNVVARPLKAKNAVREIALVWRKNSPREKDFALLAEELQAG
jgi:LysR family hydrogen peroxide-inducible transcriptional activator